MKNDKAEMGKQLVIGARKRWGAGWRLVGDEIREALIHKAVLGTVLSAVNPVDPADIRDVLAGALEELEARG